MPTLEENLRIRALLRSDLSRAGAAVTPERPRSLLRAGAAIRAIRLPSGALVKPLAAAELSGLAPSLGPAVPRLIPFAHRNGGANVRSTSVMGPFRGPGVVLDITWRRTGLGSGDLPAWFLQYSEEGSGQVFEGVGRPAVTGTMIFDPNERRMGGIDPIAESQRYIMNTNPNDAFPNTVQPLNFPITLDRWFLKHTIDTDANVQQYDGIIRLLEGVNLEDWSPFL